MSTINKRKQANPDGTTLDLNKKPRTQRRWTELECTSVLEQLKATIQRNQDIEKPTASEYYKKLMVQIGMDGVTVTQIQNKVRALRDTYTKAVQWRQNTGEGVLATDGEQSVRAYILKICPFWDLLDEVYSNKASIQPPFVHESGQVRAVEIMDHHDNDTNDESLNFLTLINDESHVYSASENVDIEPESAGGASKLKRQLTSQPKGMSKQKDALSGLTDVQMKRIASIDKKNELDSQRLQQEIKWHDDSTEFKKKELESQEARHTKELDLKRTELEIQERLRLREIEKDEAIAKYKIDQEIKLQLELES